MHKEIQTLLESNTSTFRERNEIYALTENQQLQVEATVISNLYRSAIDKSHIDFDDIPESKGDITKYAGYKSMKECISILEVLSKRYNTAIPELLTLKDAISILETNREKFVKGFMLDRDVVKMIYITTTAACVEATSVIITSYVDFVKNPNSVEFKIVTNKYRPSRTSIDCLKSLVSSSKEGKLSTILNEATSSKDNFVGVEPLVTGAIIIGAAVAVIPLMRELIFAFYYSRVRISEYLDHQAKLIELNKANIEASTLPSKEKKEVLRKQQAQADKLAKLSDKIRVESVKTQAKASSEIKQENKKWTLGEVQSQFASNDSNGFGLL